jgi:lysophospholipase L1-like esterase
MSERKSFAFRRNRDLLAFNAALAVIASILAATTYLLYDHTMQDHPEWTSTKTELERGVIGAWAFMQWQGPVTGNRLNLGAWHGFQEIVYREPLELSEVSLPFRVEDDGYIHILYDRRPDGFSGVRLSNHASFPSVHYRASADGEFLAVDTLRSVLTVSPDVWHTIRLVFEATAVRVELDEEFVATYPRVPEPGQFGLRSGQRQVWVDDIVLTTEDGRVIREAFGHTDGLPTASGAALSGLLLLTAVVLLIIRRLTSIPARSMWLGLVMVQVVLIVGLVGAFVVQFATGRRNQFVIGGRTVAEGYWIESTQREIVAGLRAKYGAAPHPDDYRILFAGTSQTWGAGARNTSGTWVRVLEELLNAADGETRFVCINAGVPGHRARRTLLLLRDSLLALRPNAAVVTLGNNDEDPAALRQNLEGIVETLRGAQVKPVLVLEPNSIERRPTDSQHGDLAVKHEVVKEIGAKYGVPVLDLHAYLATRREAGFLWWDFVHLTDFGQRLVADWLRSKLLDVLNLAPDSRGES